MDSRVIADLVLHLGRMASGDGLAEGLTAAQWAALRYFARANRFSRTPSAFAAFHGTTRGTASQTIKSLETQGYLTRTRSEADGRSARLDLIDKASAILAHDPFEALVRAADALPPAPEATSSALYSACSTRWRGSEAHLPSAPARRVSIWKATAAVIRVRCTMRADS